MKKKPKILLTNDDGIDAPGLRALWEALSDIGELYIIAPTADQSGMGVAVTFRHPLHIHKVHWDKTTMAWRITGTPADCVRLGLSEILKFQPQLLVSGINRGDNSGRNVLCSGTIGGVIEGTFRGVPGIAFSCANYDAPDYESTKDYIQKIANHVLQTGLPKGTFLNVNFPITMPIRGFKLARQGLGFWMENPLEHKHPEGHSYYWLGMKWHEYEEHEESDVSLLKQGYATAVPIHANEMTDRIFYQEYKTHFDRAFPLPESLIEE
jgi:5'/3'-nucleotidase